MESERVPSTTAPEVHRYLHARYHRLDNHNLTTTLLLPIVPKEQPSNPGCRWPSLDRQLMPRPSACARMDWMPGMGSSQGRGRGHGSRPSSFRLLTGTWFWTGDGAASHLRTIWRKHGDQHLVPKPSSKCVGNAGLFLSTSTAVF